MAGKTKSHPVRQQLAYEAARLVVDDSVVDVETARRKAAARAGVRDKRLWPTPVEVQEAVSMQQRLFRPQQHDRLRELREEALQAMESFRSFHPRLIGPVLDGSADEGTRISLHLFAEDPMEVVHSLLERHIPWNDRERTLVYGGGRRARRPAFSFMAGDKELELIVLPPDSRREPPLNPVTERPDRGAGIAELKKLLDATPDPDCDYRCEMGT